MPPKKKKSISGCGKAKPNGITSEVKKEIIGKHNNGIHVFDIAQQYNVTKLTISTISKNKEAITVADVAKRVIVLTLKKCKIPHF